MAQHTPDERFNTIFLAVMILARHFEPRRRTSEQFCPHCKKRLPPRPTGEREYLLNLGEQLNGWSAKDVKELWDLRNRLPGHGQAHLDRQARDELSAGSVKAAHLAYDALKAISGNHWPDRPHDLWMMDAIGPGIELHMTYTRASDAGPSETTDERGSQSS
jgi:hypothetical protein